MKSIAAKAIKSAITEGKAVELVDATFSTLYHERDAHYVRIDGTEYETSTRSANMVRDMFGTSYKFSKNETGKGTKQWSCAKYFVYQAA